MGWRRLAHPRTLLECLPNLQVKIDRGREDVLRSTVPTHSWAAWPSFLTGSRRPITGFATSSVTYRSIKERTFVEDLSAAGKIRVCADVPLMFPPSDINAKVLAGPCCRKGRTSTQPADSQALSQNTSIALRPRTLDV